MFKTISCIFVVFCCVLVVQAQTPTPTPMQTYPLVKVTMNNGTTIKGKKCTLSSESVSFLSGGVQNTYQLSDIQLIQAKEGKAGKWALGCAGGCLAICVVAGVASGAEGIEEAGGTVGTYVAGSVIWTGIFAGVGALIGSLSDEYTNVYLAKSSYLKEKIKLDFRSDQLNKYNFVLSYKF
jgi:hypothetical protein